MKRRPSFYLIVVIVLLVGAILACGGATDQVREASETDVVAESSGEDASQERAPEADTPATEVASTDVPATATDIPATDTPEATATATLPPPTPTPDPEDLQLIAQGFGQDGTVVGYAFTVQNPNEGLAIESAQYQVTAYDASGAIAETDSNSIALILPGQTLGVASSMYLDDGVVVDSVEVRLSGGDAVASESLPTFTVSNIMFHADEFFNEVTGIIESPYDRDFSDVRVSAVLYNEADEIVGGGFTYVNFIPAESTTGLKMSVDGGNDVARAEVYPVLSNLSLFGEREIPEDGTAAALQKSGFGQEGIEVGYGILVENPNNNYMIESLLYRVTAYGADGGVLGVDEGYAPTFLPQQTLGIGGDIYLVTDQPVERLEAQISGGRYLDPESDAQPFSAEEATFQQGSFSSQVTGFVINPYDQDTTDLRVSAIVYNESDEIVGGGYTFLDFASASNRTAVEVSVVATGTPAHSELYPTLSNLSEFQ